MILPASWEQVPLIRTARREGAWVLACDENPEAAGREEADAFETIAPRNLSGLLDAARRHKIEAVATDECDYSVYAAAYLAAKLDLPGPTLYAAAAGTNKRLQRERCKDAGLPQPEFAACSSLEEAQAATNRLRPPVVVKPVDNRGSFGVSVVEEPGQLREAFLDAVTHSHSREVLIERYIEGTVLTVEGFGFGRTHQSMTLSSKIMLPGRHKVAVQLIYPAEISDRDRQRVLDLHTKVAEACGFLTGPTHGEYILDKKGGLFLIEIANRGCGALISPLVVPILSGLDVCSAILRQALGRAPKPPEPPEGGRAAVLDFFGFPPGTITRFEGLDEVRKAPGILDARIMARAGDPIPPSVNALTRHGFILAEGRDRSEALDRARTALKSLRGIYADGSSVTPRDAASLAEAR